MHTCLRAHTRTHTHTHSRTLSVTDNRIIRPHTRARAHVYTCRGFKTGDI